MGDAAGYFLTFRTYGTWLHGDERGSVDRRHNAYGEERIAPDESLRRFREAQLGHEVFLLDSTEKRRCVRDSIERTCNLRDWTLWALNVRTNHVHCVLTADKPINQTLSDLKAWATRSLREHGLAERDRPVWSYHGSTKFLYEDRDISAVTDYTLFEQGPDLD